MVNENSYELAKWVSTRVYSIDLETRAVISNELDREFLELESNANPTQTTTAITEHINTYLSKQELPDSLKFVKLKLKGKLTDAPVLKDVFLADLRQLDTVNIDVNFSAEKRNLVAKVEAQFINYADNELDSLAFNLNSSRDSLTFNFGLKSLKAGPIAIKRT